MPAGPQDRHGLLWRPIEPADLPELSGLLTAIEHLDEPHERHSLAELAEELAEADAVPARDTIIGRADGVAVAYGWNHPMHADVDPRRVHLTGGVHPGWRRRGIGAAVLAWQLDRARDWYEQTRRAGHGPFRAICTAEAKLVEARRLYEQAGLTPVRWFADMVRMLDGALPEVSPPPGIRLIPLRRRLYEAVRQAHNAAFADHWGAQAVDSVRWLEQLGRESSRVGWSWVALAAASSEVVGYALNSAYQQDWEAQGFSEGWTDRLGVRPGWRGRGIASALLAASMRSFAEAGLDAAGLGVDTDSLTGARRLYESLGYQTVDTTVMYASGARPELD